VVLADHHLVDSSHRDPLTSSGFIRYNSETSCLWYFPSIDRLSRWQHDIRLRRLGRNSGSLYDLTQLSLFPSSSFNHFHMTEFLEAIESIIPLYGNILYFEDSPLLFPLWKLSLGRHLLLSSHCQSSPSSSSTSVLCISLNTSHGDENLMRYQSLCPKKIHVFVINFDSVLKKRDERELQWIWNWLHQVQVDYLIVIGRHCLTSPTDLVITSYNHLECSQQQQQQQQYSTNATAVTMTTLLSTSSPELLLKLDENKASYCQQVQTTYSLVEDVCLENGSGMTIYRNMKTLPANWIANRHGVSKRIAGHGHGEKVIARRIIERGQS
jgi:hypothetical protein